MGFRSEFARQQSWPAHVRFGSKADIGARPRHVRFTPKSGHRLMSLSLTISISPRGARMSGTRITSGMKRARVSHGPSPHKNGSERQPGLFGRRFGGFLSRPHGCRWHWSAVEISVRRPARFAHARLFGGLVLIVLAALGRLFRLVAFLRLR